MKKKYTKPSVEVVKMQYNSIICTSSSQNGNVLIDEVDQEKWIWDEDGAQ